MGTVVLFMLSCLAAVAQPDLGVVVTSEPVRPGVPFWVEVATTPEASLPVGSTPVLSLSGGEASALMPTGPGRWKVQMQTNGLSPLKLSLEWQGQTRSIVVTPVSHHLPKIELPQRVVGEVGQPLSFTVLGGEAGGLKPKDLRVAVAEGTVKIDCETDDACQVSWHPGPSRYPRAVPLFIHDARNPSVNPAVVLARLSARPTIPVQTEPGATVSLKISGREYGPSQADNAGRVVFSVLVNPGDKTAIATLEDRLGNRQKSTILLGASRGETLSLTHSGSNIQGGISPRVLVAVVSAQGELGGAAPVCEGLAEAKLYSAGPGLWVGHVSLGSEGDQRVACVSANGAEGAIRLPVERSRATRLVLQSYPEHLNADIPIAEIHAFLVNGAGDRLQSSDVQIKAQLGTVRRDVQGSESLVRARYDGGRAASVGEDLLTASWSRPVGEGGLWDLAVRGAAPGEGDEVLVDVRAVDQGGRPIAGVSVNVEMHGQNQEINTGAHGWGTTTFPWPEGREIGVIVARAEGATRRGMVLKGDRALTAAGSPDLVTELYLPISAGRVAGVVLNTHPRVLSNDGMVAEVSVRLEDRLGNLIFGPQVEITASIGTVGPVQIRPSGLAVASYAPPIGMTPQRVRLTATTADGHFRASTDVEVVHRQVAWSLGTTVGLLAGENGLATLRSSILVEKQSPTPRIYGRMDLNYFQLTAAGVDPVTGTPVDMTMDAMPIGVGLVLREGRRRVPFWLGAQLVLAPYRLRVNVGDVLATSEWAWMQPGANFIAGTGLRWGGGELFSELQYLFVAPANRSTGWSGSVGGVAIGLGYKLLY